jgi:hypothetical protein
VPAWLRALHGGLRVRVCVEVRRAQQVSPQRVAGAADRDQLDGLDDDLDERVGDVHDIDHGELIEAEQQRRRVVHARGIAC